MLELLHNPVGSLLLQAGTLVHACLSPIQAQLSNTLL